DYKQQEFEQVLRGYHAILGTVRGDSLEKALQIHGPDGTVVSLVGPPHAAFARKRVMNFLMRLVFGLLSSKIIPLQKKPTARHSPPQSLCRPDTSPRRAALRSPVRATRLPPRTCAPRPGRRRGRKPYGRPGALPESGPFPGSLPWSCPGRQSCSGFRARRRR